MKISVQFNWPTDKATLIFSGPSVEDQSREYFIGIWRAHAEEEKKDWFSPSKNHTERILLDRKDSFMIQSRDRKSKKAIQGVKFVIEEEWPADAIGDTMVDRSLGYI